MPIQTFDEIIIYVLNAKIMDIVNLYEIRRRGINA